MDEGLPVEHPTDSKALLLKLDWLLNPANTLSFSYNFNHSRRENDTFDVATYGTSANGIEGDPARIHVANLNLFSTVSPTALNELHFTYSREVRPRTARESGLAADTGIGFAPSFRFGNPFFLQPNVDETLWRTQIKDNFSLIKGKHTFKVGGEWMHTLNDQVFRGFFTGRYLFDSVPGFLRYASPAAPGGFGPRTNGCSDGSYVTFPDACPAGTTASGGPLLFYLQGAGRTGLATDETGASNVTNNEFALFVQDTWQVTPRLTLNYGLRWDAQFMPETVDPATTAYAPFLNDPRFPSDGTIPDQKKQFQPRFGLAWDVNGNQKSVVRANAGIYYARQNILSQVGSVTTNGLQQQSIFRNSGFVSFADMPVWPNLLTPAPLPAGQFPDFTGVRVFDRDYRNPKVYTVNVGVRAGAGFEPLGLRRRHVGEGRPHDALHQREPRRSRGAFRAAPRRGDGDDQPRQVALPRPHARPAQALLGRLADGRELRALEGPRRRLQRARPVHGPQLRPGRPGPGLRPVRPRHPAQVQLLRLRRSCPAGSRATRASRPAARSRSRPARASRTATTWDATACARTTSTSRSTGACSGRSACPAAPSSSRWSRCSTRFNSDNNVNPLSTPALFNFDGFLRTGVGDPRQVQVAVKLTF